MDYDWAHDLSSQQQETNAKLDTLTKHAAQTNERLDILLYRVDTTNEKLDEVIGLLKKLVASDVRRHGHVPK